MSELSFLPDVGAAGEAFGALLHAVLAGAATLHVLERRAAFLVDHAPFIRCRATP